MGQIGVGIGRTVASWRIRVLAQGELSRDLLRGEILRWGPFPIERRYSHSERGQEEHLL